ncbi:putative integral membrane protein [Methylophaga frappieri]|uniref:Putative integral membrane protein n=1 Tax=Methylophaga frappieri (strain ATCC BAA-2434 / DSM 25690 / JAM7) TaxID=754477 RepID=I1YK04_METFJ|nr:mechanosensitive ion channel domain-containing protein [Methylophaga frappieri]AFJ03247.1 putative integral membrane protein [Methylophaga frappieri]
MFESLDALSLNLPSEIVVSDSLIGLIISSVILITAVLILRALAARFIRQKIESYELRRRWLVQSRNGLILFMALGLIFIWGQELRTLALSVVAIAVAFVVATKELILCVMGSLLKTGAGSFTIGDRIQVKEFRGDVIDQNLLATTILEVGPGQLIHQRTGRLVVLPNAIFVAEPVINESYTNDYTLHVFTVPFKREDDWQAAQKAFLKAAQRHCQPYLEEVRNYMNQISRHRGVEVPSVEPRVTLQVPEADEIHLVIRIPARAFQRVQVEQAILNEALTGILSPVEP